MSRPSSTGSVQPRTSGYRLVRLRGSGRGAAADMVAHRKADEQGFAAQRTTPLRTVAVLDVRAAGRLRVQLLERPLLATSGAVPGQLAHPGDLLGAVQHGRAADKLGVA